MSSVSDRAAGLAPAARLLASWWSRPTADEIDRWAESWPRASELEPGVVAALEAAAEASEPEALLEEYERLLVGPGRVPCAPYESLWRDDVPRREQGRLMGDVAEDIARIYRDIGLRVRADAHELPDHIAIEWEALAYALEQGADDAADELARTHLGAWVPRFCAAVAAATQEPFYAALAEVTSAWTAARAR